MKLIDAIRKVINPFGVDLKPYPREDIRRRLLLFKDKEIDTIIDVGANQGQYAKELIDGGFSGKIVSFEPVSKNFNMLSSHSQNFKNWSVEKIGLGAENKNVDINISKNLYSSSILDINENHVDAAPDSKFITRESIEIRKLDDIFYDYFQANANILMKIDVQGYEKNVLEGSLDVLNHINGIQLEMSLEELYDGEILFNEMLQYIFSLGYELYSLENGFYNQKSGKLLQVDGIFFKK